MLTTSKNTPQVYLTAANLRARYNRTDMTIHRWLRDPEMNFPRPYYLGGIAIGELTSWNSGKGNRRASLMAAIAAPPATSRRRRDP